MSRLDESSHPDTPTEVVVSAMFQARLNVAQAEAQPDFLGRYQSVSLLGYGGMGEVWKAHDPQMGRDLALKVLLVDVARSPAAVARFVDEARIAAKLQHPNVVPIYEVGHLDDGRPYFTMKLVTGRTLAEILNSDTRTDPDQLLQIFEKVCQAVAYAHSEGVIHRDLKPANVMVGAFGEVQVMDWGIAKLLHQSEPRPPVIDHDDDTISSEGEDSSRTRAGTVMGTFAYMPPEQARGEIADLDERADVFALGAMLCEILTGSPPYQGDSGEAMQALAIQGDLTLGARNLDESGADPALIELAKACLAPVKEDRPRDARSIAETVTEYRIGLAERLQVEKYARVASRHRMRLTFALAGSLIVLACLLAVGTIRWQAEQSEQQQKLALVRSGAEGALAKVDRELPAGNWTETAHALDEAELVLRTHSRPEVADLGQRIVTSRSLLKTAQTLEQIRLRRNVSRNEKINHRFSAEYHQAFDAAGLDVLQGDLDELEQSFRDSPIRDQFLRALDDWTLVTFFLEPEQGEPLRDRLLALTRRVDPHSELRQALAAPDIFQDKNALEALAESTSEEATQSPALCLLLTQLLEQVGANPVPLLEQALDIRPDDFWLHFEIGNTLIRLRRPDDAIGHLRAAMTLRPKSDAVWGNLGVALISAGRYDESIKVCRRAIAMNQESAIHRINLGKAMKQAGDVEAALSCYQDAVRLDPQMSSAHFNLAVTLSSLGRDEEAIAEYRLAIAGPRPEVWAFFNLGEILQKTGDEEAATIAYRKGADAAEWKACYGLGQLLERRGDLKGALWAYERLSELRPQFAEGHGARGRALLFACRFEEAALASWKALNLLPEDSPQRKPAIWQINTAEHMSKANKHLEAIRAGETQPRTVGELLDLAELCRRYRKEYDAAISFYEQAFKVEPRAAESRSGALRFRAARTAVLAGQLDKALDWLQADLEAWRGFQNADNFDRERIVGGLGWWLSEPDLVRVREPEQLQELPQEQRAAWNQLWTDVQTLLTQVTPTG